jgi:CelD/BcsL family acetyltransferase involved in cellulose biosynthesis
MQFKKPPETSAPPSETLEGPQVRVERDFDFSGTEYLELFEASDATGFQHPIWLKALYDNLADFGGYEPTILTCRTTSGQLQAVVPLVLRSAKGVRILEAADQGLSDYCIPVLRPNALSTLSREGTLAERVNRALPSHDLVRINKIPQAHRAHWRAFFAHTQEAEAFSAHSVQLGTNYKAWETDTLSKSFRNSLRYKTRKLRKETSASLKRLVQIDEVEHAFDQIRALRKSKNPNELLQSSLFFSFYKRLIKYNKNSHFVSIYELSSKNQKIAYLLGINHNKIFYYILFGCDYEIFSKYSPGLVIYGLVISDAIDRRCDVFDFTIGDEGFKSKFGTSSTKLFRINKAATARGRIALLGRSLMSATRGSLAPIRRLRS